MANQKIPRQGILKRYIFAPNVLEVRSTSSNIYDFKFGIPWVCERRIPSNLPSSRVILEWREVKDVPNYMEKIGLSLESSDREIPYIFRETPLPFGRKAQLFLRWGGDGFNAQLVTNKDYFRWSLLRLTSSSHHPLPGTILSDAAYIALLESDYLPMHCACVDFNKMGVLLIAPSDTGKTSTSQILVRSYGFRFVAEDIAVTNGKEIVGCAYTGTGVPGKKPALDFFEKIRQIFFYPIFKQGFYYRESLAADLDPSLITPKTNANYIIFLKRGKNKITKIGKEEAATLLLKSIRLEFRYLTDIFLLQLWHQYNVPDIQKMMEKENKIIGSLVNQLKGILAVSAESPEDFASQINNFIREEKK